MLYRQQEEAIVVTARMIPKMENLMRTVILVQALIENQTGTGCWTMMMYYVICNFFFCHSYMWRGLPFADDSIFFIFFEQLDNEDLPNISMTEVHRLEAE